MGSMVTLADGTTVEVSEDGMVTRDCPRCSGRGMLNGFRHVLAGVCFQCGGREGERSWTEPLAEVEKRAKRRVSDRARRERKVSAKRAKFDEWKSERAEFVETLMEAGRSQVNGFITDIADRVGRFEILTERQEAAARNALAEIQCEADEVEESPTVPTGQVEITGVVVSMRRDRSQYGFVKKMLVESDSGFRVWGTKPSSLDGIERGDRVIFTATVEPRDDDPSFGFFSNPTKARKE